MAIQPAPTPNARPIRMPIDSHHVIIWKIADTNIGAGSTPNTGNGGACDLIFSGSGPAGRGYQGPFGYCASIGPDRNIYRSARPAPINIPDNYTMEIWVNGVWEVATQWQWLFHKKRLADTSWVTGYPIFSAAIYPYYGGINGEGSNIAIGSRFGGPRVIFPNSWCHLALTWNATSKNLRLWLNGSKIAEGVGTAVDKGTNGEWMLGAKHANDFGEGSVFFFDDVRVSDIERDQAYFDHVRYSLPGFTQAP